MSAVAPELSTNGQLVYGRENTFTQVLGVTPEYVGVRNLELSTGGFISDGHVVNRSEVIVLGSFVSETLFGLRDPVGQTVKVNGRPFTIIGVLDSMGGGPFGLFDDQVLVPITTAYYRLASERTTQGDVTVNLISVQVQDESLMDQAEAQIATLLRLRHRVTGEDDFTINNQQDTLGDPGGDHRHFCNVPGSHRGHLAACGRYRHHEHNAGLRHGAHPGDRHS